MEIGGKTVLFLGDSITEGHGTSGNDKTFCSIIARKYNAHCVNYGIGGTRIARQSKSSEEPRCDRDFCSRVSEMQSDANAVVVFGGTNDFGHGDAPIGSMDDRTPETFYGALHTLYSSLIEKYPGIPIVVITPLHRTNENNSRGDGYKAATGPLTLYVKIIREVAEYYSLPVLDLFAVSGLQPNVPVIRERYVPDGLHPNDAGHMILAEKIGKFLESL